MKTSVLLLVLLSHSAFTVKHSLKFIYTASSGVSDFPEFTAAAVVDEALVTYCDAKIHVREDWMKSVFVDDPQQLQRYTQECVGNQPSYFRATINNLKQRFNQSGGVHILQRVSGCEWDDETGEFNGFNQYGYNGEDFISFDLKTLTWIAPSPQAFSTKLKWDTDKYKEGFNKFHLTQVFPEWLKMYIEYGKKTLMRTVLPSVSLLQKSPSSPVSCHATGFFPDRAVMFWRRDGEELQEDVDHGEILPNHDGSFQISVDLLTLPSDDWEKYECVFQLSGVEEDQVYKLNKDLIRTNHVPSHDLTIIITIIIIISVFAVICLMVAGAASKYLRARRSEPISENSSELSERLSETESRQLMDPH